MRPRTVAAILSGLLLIVAVSYLSHANVELLKEPFRLTGSLWVPAYVALLATFLLGFLPVASVLLVQTLRRDLAQRRVRRFEREAESRQAGFRRAVDLERDGQWGRAAAELEVLLADQPEDFGTLLRYGSTLRRAGRAAEAVEVHRRASVLYPQSGALIYELAEDYEADAEPEVAEQLRERLLRDHPGLGLEEALRRRDLAVASGSWEEAKRLQERIDDLRTEPDAGESELRRGLDYQVAEALLDENRYDEAREILQALLERAPDFLPAYLLLGEAAVLQGEDDLALREWRRGWEATGSPVLLQRIEDHHIERENPMGAIETLHGLMSPPDDLVPRYFLGRLYHRLEMPDEALRTFEGIADRMGRAPVYHYLMARLYRRLGQQERAVEALLRSVRQGGLLSTEYRCSGCAAGAAAWTARCDACGAWGSIDIEVEEDSVVGPAGDPYQAPIWSDRAGSDDTR